MSKSFCDIINSGGNVRIRFGSLHKDHWPRVLQNIEGQWAQQMLAIRDASRKRQNNANTFYLNSGECGASQEKQRPTVAQLQGLHKKKATAGLRPSDTALAFSDGHCFHEPSKD